MGFRISHGMLGLAAALWVAAPAHATLLGDRIDITLDFVEPQFLDQGASQVEVVTPASELSGGWTGPLFFAFGQVSVDVDDSQVWITITSGTEDVNTEAPFAPAFTLWLEDLEWVGMPGYVIDQVIPAQGNTANVSVGAVGPNEIHFDFPGFEDMSGGNGFSQSAHFDITHRVPEPGVLLLLLAPLTALACRGRAAD